MIKKNQIYKKEEEYTNKISHTEAMLEVKYDLKIRSNYGQLIIRINSEEKSGVCLITDAVFNEY